MSTDRFDTAITSILAGLVLCVANGLPACGDDGGSTTPPETCGNGELDRGEICDDGDLNGQYGLNGYCNADCSGYGPRCGDGSVDGPESCDDGDLNGQYDYCGEDCLGAGPRCGDGLMQSPEYCDDGELNGQYGQHGYCNESCTAIGPRCGDGDVNGPETCDEGGLNGRYGHCNESCTGDGPHCGDGNLDEDEEVCDDGRFNGQYDHCNTSCSGDGPHCGDGNLDEPNEVCDDGIYNGLYNFCDTDCQGLGHHCGDGVVDEGQELCDDGELNGQYGYCNTGCGRSAFPFPSLPGDVSDEWLDNPPTCGPYDWFVKYLHYRRRFRGNGTAEFPGFVSVGPDAGESIPPTFRLPTTNCSNDWWIQDAGCTGEYPSDANGWYQWGDATIWLGEYIAVLATEYAVFDRAGMDTSQTEEDLYYAINAFNRVDETAELFYGVTPARDGFFLRDDVPPDFMWDDDAERYRYPRDDNELNGYGCHTSVLACQVPRIDGGDFISQDQVIGLIWGFGLVDELVPDGIVVNSVDLRQESRAIVHRMVWHLRSHDWRVTDPDGDHPPDAWGGNAIGFSDQFAKAANAICGDDFGVDDYRDSMSRNVGAPIFEAMQAPGIWDATHGYNRTMAFRLVTFTNEWDADTMARRTVADAKETFALGHAIVNHVDTGAALSLWRLESMLSLAPCGGPCHNLQGCEDGEGWKGQHRFTSPEDRAIWKHHPAGEYNGLDYMLAHNLYYLVRDGAYDFQIPKDVVRDCSSVDMLDDIIESEGDATFYDPTNPCHYQDMAERYCGRTLAGWIDAAYRGEVTLFTGGTRWSCSGYRPCTLSEADLDGTSGSDLIIGTPWNDDIDGNGGDDCIYGLEGDDFIAGGQGYDEIHGGPGNDELYGENSGVVLDGEADVIWGEDGNDYIKGNPGNDELYGGDGDDEIIGDGGGDFIEGHAGNDTIDGQAGEDSIGGGADDDIIIGGGGDDVIYGEGGNDALDGEDGDDWVYGNEGNDFVRGGAGNDSVVADSGADRLCGGNGDDTLWGGWDGDACLAGSGTNTVNGCTDGTATEEQCDEALESW